MTKAYEVNDRAVLNAGTGKTLCHCDSDEYGSDVSDDAERVCAELNRLHERTAIRYPLNGEMPDAGQPVIACWSFFDDDITMSAWDGRRWVVNTTMLSWCGAQEEGYGSEPVWWLAFMPGLGHEKMLSSALSAAMSPSATAP